MRGEDRPPALAFLDQQTILRQVLRDVRAAASIETSSSSDHFAGRWSFDRARNQAATTPTGHRASRQHTSGAELNERADRRRRRLHLRCANQERHALLATRSWTSALLAAQRPARHAPCWEVAGPL